MDTNSHAIIEAFPGSAAPVKVALRNVYTVEQFAEEILCGNRTPDWVRQECRGKRIKTVASHPWLIPMSEAHRFLFPQSKR